MTKNYLKTLHLTIVPVLLLRGELMKQKHECVAVGGTFDSLHEGHKLLLKKCFEVGNKVIIGITSDKLARFKAHYVPPLNERVKLLKRFLESIGVSERAQIVILNDPYGPTINSEDISAIVVSEETLPRALEINRIRESRGLSPLEIVVVSLVKDNDLRPLSAAKIRRQERLWKSFIAK